VQSNIPKPLKNLYTQFDVNTFEVLGRSGLCRRKFTYYWKLWHIKKFSSKTTNNGQLFM